MTTRSHDGKPTKTNEEILAENSELARRMTARGQFPISQEAEALFAIYERLGDIWLWAKERR